ncbi:MAG: hypothetical protein WAX77_12540 [Methylococcaceae bacterium]
MLNSTKLFTALTLLLMTSMSYADYANVKESRTTNYYYWSAEYTLSGDSYVSLQRACPSDYPNVLSGSCGHRDYNNSQNAIVLSYTGVTPNSETSSWQCKLKNTSSASKALKFGVICAK